MARKPRRVIWAPKAKQDLHEVWRYYALVASPDVADRLLRDIDATGERLADQALMWRARDDVMPGLRSVAINPYIIFIACRATPWKSHECCMAGATSLRYSASATGDKTHTATNTLPSHSLIFPSMIRSAGVRAAQNKAIGEEM